MAGLKDQREVLTLSYWISASDFASREADTTNRPLEIIYWYQIIIIFTII